MEMLAAKDAASTETDASSLLKADVIQLEREIKLAIKRTKDPLTLYHLKDLEHRIKGAITSKQSI